MVIRGLHIRTHSSTGHRLRDSALRIILARRERSLCRAMTLATRLVLLVALLSPAVADVAALEDECDSNETCSMSLRQLRALVAESTAQHIAPLGPWVGPWVGLCHNFEIVELLKYLVALYEPISFRM